MNKTVKNTPKSNGYKRIRRDKKRQTVRLAIITSKCNRKYVMWLSLPPTTNTNRY